MIEDADEKYLKYEIFTKGRMMEDSNEKRSKVSGKLWVWEGVETWAGTFLVKCSCDCVPSLNVL